MVIQRALRAAAVVAVVTTVGFGAVAPARADTQAKKDPARDVGIIDKAPPKPAGIDIISSRNTYEGQTLRMSLTTIKLLKKGYSANWTITVPGVDDTFYRLKYDHTQQQPKVTFTELHPERRAPGCPGVKAVAKGNSVIASVPRSCIGGTNQVRVATYTLRPTGSDSPKIDDARQDGWASESLQFGPILARG